MIAASDIAQIPQNEVLDLLRDMGTATCRTTLPDIDHVKAVVRVAEDECIVVCSSIADGGLANPPVHVPTYLAAALSRGEPYAYDRMRSVLRAPFN